MKRRILMVMMICFGAVFFSRFVSADEWLQTSEEKVDEVLAQLTWEEIQGIPQDPSAVVKSLDLPTGYENHAFTREYLYGKVPFENGIYNRFDVNIGWNSDNKSILYWAPDKGERGRIFPGAKDFPVTLTAVVQCGEVRKTKTFTLVVKAGQYFIDKRIQHHVDWNAPRLDKVAFMCEKKDMTFIHLINATHATWWSEDESIATVNQAGAVFAKRKGETTIFAKVGETVLECKVTIGYTKQNPVLPASWELFIADGEPHVYNGTLYVYGSHDTKVPFSTSPNNPYCSDDYHVIYTKDGTHWVDAGVSFTAEDLPGDYKDKIPVLWAPDSFYYHGKYYLLSCGRDSDGEYFIAESTSPTGPFTNARRIEYEDKTAPLDAYGHKQLEIGNIDPGVLVDNGVVWLAMAGLNTQARNYKDIFWSSDFRYGKLNVETATVEYNENYAKVSDAMKTSPTTYPFEGPSLRKFGDYYYYIYAAANTGANTPINLDYCYTKDINDPTSWQYGGTIINNVGFYNGGNIHGSIEYFHGKYYVAYHTNAHVIATNSNCRNFRLDEVNINQATGEITQAKMTSSGVAHPAFTLNEKIPAASLVSVAEDPEEVEIIGNPFVKRENTTEDVIHLTSGLSVQYRYANLFGAKRVTVLVKANTASELSFQTSNGEFAKVSLAASDDYQKVVVPFTNSVNGRKEISLKATGSVLVKWFKFS